MSTIKPRRTFNVWYYECQRTYVQPRQCFGRPAFDSGRARTILALFGAASWRRKPRLEIGGIRGWLAAAVMGGKRAIGARVRRRGGGVFQAAAHRPRRDSRL